MADDKEMKKTAQMIKDNYKKAFTEGQARAKEITKFIEKSDSTQELEKIMKLVTDLHGSMNKKFDAQVRVLKVAMANAGKKK